MKKGFTLIELMIVIIIIAILAIVAMTQYQPVMERARSSEAKDALGFMRKTCGAIYFRDRNVAKCIPENLGIGIEPGNTPPDCFRTHYFNYSVEESPSFDNVMIFTANRCTKFGRSPDAKQPGSLTLTVDYENNTAKWSTKGLY
jgi:prepilin-type N-terminal cleavage/methylation domain-containing protein